MWRYHYYDIRIASITVAINLLSIVSDVQVVCVSLRGWFSLYTSLKVERAVLEPPEKCFIVGDNVMVIGLMV